MRARDLAVAMLLLAVVASATARAQGGEPGAGDRTNVEVDPVTCWWRSSATAVRIGEPFAVVLTCSLLQTEAARAVADESRLDAAVVQLPPFEVIGGARADDVTTPGRRFIQYEYRLQLIAENVFAADVTLPPVQVGHRIESQVGGGEALAGRDLTYALPPIPLRVLSLVPETALDIREAAIPSFAEIDDTGFRALLLRVVAGTLFAAGGVLVAFALLGVARRRRSEAPDAARALPPAAVLRAVLRELTQARREIAASGWTSELAGRALAAARIVAAYESGRNVSQRAYDPAFRGALEGQLVVRRRGTATVVSAAATAAEAEGLSDALARFADARYGREERFDSPLDEALASVIEAAERLMSGRPAMEKLWSR